MISRTNTSGFGCYISTYPSLNWANSTCGHQYDSSSSFTIGGCCIDDDAKAVNGGNFTTVTGNFASESGFTSECSTSPLGCIGNYYSLQLNSDSYSLKYCQGSTCYTCRTGSLGTLCVKGWEQFIFSNYYSIPCPQGCGEVGIEYWLLNYVANVSNCPSPWFNANNYDCQQLLLNTALPFEYPQYLYYHSLTGTVSSYQKQANFC